VSVDAVSARYVEALFRLAMRQGVLAQVDADVRGLDVELSCPRVLAFLLDARVAVEERRGKLVSVLASAHPLTRNLVGLLFDKRREEVLSHLVAAWRERSLQERGGVEGVVQSARPLGAAEVSRLEASLGARLRKDVKLANEVQPELVGGVRVLVDNKMLDRTVQGRLDGLRRRLMTAPLQVGASD